MKNYFKRLFRTQEQDQYGNWVPKKNKFMFTTKNIAMRTGNGDLIADAARSEIDRWSSVDAFMPLSFSTGNPVSIGSSVGTSGGVLSSGTGTPTAPVDTRKAVEPKAVFGELKKEQIEFSFENLDAKIDAVENRISVLKEHLDEAHLGDEHRSLFYLKNRRTYLNKTMKKLPLDWAMTNQAAVDDLCKRYKLRVVPLKQYYTLVPNEGIQEMDRYTKAYEAITGDKPIFQLVIKEAEVKSEEQKQQRKKDRDPILLANSPLGNFMFVLGAWDDEVEYIDEIIYQGK